MKSQMKFSDFDKYKHDTYGKLSTIKSLIETLDENSLKDPESIEILEALDEVYARMSLSSKELLTKLQNH